MKKFLTLTVAAMALTSTPALAAGDAVPAIPTPPGFEGCFPVMSELRPGEVLYWTGNPALGNCATPVIDGPSIYVAEDEDGDGSHDDDDGDGSHDDDDGNNGHGNDDDGHDDSNPGKKS